FSSLSLHVALPISFVFFPFSSKKYSTISPFGLPFASKDMLVYFLIFNSVFCSSGSGFSSSLEQANNKKLTVKRNSLVFIISWFYEYPTASPIKVAVVQSVIFTFTKSPAL